MERPVRQPRHQLARGEHRRPAGHQLQRPRQTVELTAYRGHGRRLVGLQAQARPQPAAQVGEQQPYGAHLGQRHRIVVEFRTGGGQRGERDHLAAGQRLRYPGGDQHAQAGAAVEQFVEESRVHAGVGAVEHQQGGPLPDRPGESGDRLPAAVDPAHRPSRGEMQPSRDLQDQPGLADPAQAGHGDQPVSVHGEGIGQHLDLQLPADDRAPGDRWRGRFVARFLQERLPARGRLETRPVVALQPQRVGQQPDRLLPGALHPPALHVPDRPHAEGRVIGEHLLGQPDTFAPDPEQLAEARRRLQGRNTVHA